MKVWERVVVDVVVSTLLFVGGAAMHHFFDASPATMAIFMLPFLLYVSARLPRLLPFRAVVLVALTFMAAFVLRDRLSIRAVMGVLFLLLMLGLLLWAFVREPRKTGA